MIAQLCPMEQSLGTHQIKFLKSPMKLGKKTQKLSERYQAFEQETGLIHQQLTTSLSSFPATIQASLIDALTRKSNTSLATENIKKPVCCTALKHIALQNITKLLFTRFNKLVCIADGQSFFWNLPVDGKLPEFQFFKEYSDVASSNTCGYIAIAEDSSITIANFLLIKVQSMETVGGKGHVLSCFNCDDSKFVVCDNNRLKLYESSGSKDKQYSMNSDSKNIITADVQFLEAHPKNKNLLATMHSTNITLWNIATGQCEKTFESEHPIRAINFHHSGDYMAIIDSAQNFIIWNIETKKTQKFTFPTSLIAMHFHPLYDTVVALAFESEVIFWDLALNRQIAQLKHLNPIIAIRFSPHGRYIATADANAVYL